MPATATATDRQRIIDSYPAHLRYLLGELDERDAAIKAEIQAGIDTLTGQPRVGDFIEFANGTVERVSHVWDGMAEHGGTDGVQTSEGGSWHVSRGGASFSGGLNSIIPMDTLTDTGETRKGSGWFWHHDWSGANRGVPATFTFRVYRSTATR